MTTNSPNPVDGDVQALIEHIKAVIDEYERFGAGGMDEQVYRIALAALTAEPFCTITVSDLGPDTWGHSVAITRKDAGIYKVYTTPPAQLLRPVELPDCEFGAVSHMSGGSKDYCNGFVDGTNNAIKAIRAAGYEVKS